MFNFSIRSRLIGSMAAIVLVSAAAFGYIGVSYYEDLLRHESLKKLQALNKFQKTGIEKYFSGVKSSLNSIASGFVASQAVNDFEEAVYFVHSSLSVALDTLRPELAGGALDISGADSSKTEMYRQAYHKYHRFFGDFVQAHKASGLLIVEPAGGYVIYSAGAGIEFGQSAFGSALKDTLFGKTVRETITGEAKGPVFTEFSAYPGGKDPSSAFIAAPVKDGNEIIGAMAVRISLSRLESMLERRLDPDMVFSSMIMTGAGETVASYGPVLGGAIIPAGSGQEFYERDGDSGAVYGMQAPLEIPGHDYYLYVETGAGDILAPSGRVKLALGTAALFISALAAALFWFLSQSVFPPLAALAAAMKSAAATGRPAEPLREIEHEAENEVSSLNHLFNDLNRIIERGEIEDHSKTKSFDQYTESLTQQVAELKEYADKADGKLEEKEATIAKMTEVMELMQANLEKQEGKIKAAAGKGSFEKDETVRAALDVAGKNLQRPINELLKLAGEHAEESAEWEAVSARLCAIGLLSGKILTFLELETQIEPPEKTEQDMATVSRMAVSALSRAAKARKINLTLNVEGEPKVFVNRGRIVTAMANLVENAIQNTPAGGEVAVTVYDAETMTSFEVADTGAGIERGNIQSVFEKFVRLPGDGAEDHPGFGLGLHICREIVRNHDGRIGAESDIGKGSRFFFELPKVTGPAQGSIPGMSE